MKNPLHCGMHLLINYFVCYLTLNDGINVLISSSEKGCRRLHEKVTVLKLIKEMPRTLKAAKTKIAWTTVI